MTNRGGGRSPALEEADEVRRKAPRSLSTTRPSGLSARERIDALLDEGSFTETDVSVGRQPGERTDETGAPREAVVTGWGTIHGRDVFVYAEDREILDGSFGELVGQKICKIMDLAIESGAPVIGLHDSAGFRIGDGIDALNGFGRVMDRKVRASGVIPQISAIMGLCTGGIAFGPGLSDFTFVVSEATRMFVTTPKVTETVTGERVSEEQLGGAASLASKSGVAHAVAETGRDCLEQIRYLTSFLPSNNLGSPPYFPPTDDPQRPSVRCLELMPDSPNQVYDMHQVIEDVFDEGEFFEIQEHWARNLIVGFARLAGHSVGVVANQPEVLAGTLDSASSEKGARFVRFCDAFNIPLVALVDVPGFLPGIQQEYGGIIRHGAKLVYAFSEATVPKVTVITRKAYGGAYIVMNSKHLRADASYAWSSAEIAVMGAEGAVGVIHRKAIAAASDPDSERQRLLQKYRERFANPYAAAERGYLDDVIDPRETRGKLVHTLEMLRSKREVIPQRKHGSIPL